MARNIPIRPEPPMPPKRTGLRGWIARLRGQLDQLVYQLIRMPSRRVCDPGDDKAGKESRRH